ncbi:MAG: hypothetical protein FWG93_04355 [Oscillospiraceae bacterium]|nr:hypothetical protein [Oscillospiraceae bacterium]
MATNSILKDVRMKSKDDTKRLIRALEGAGRKSHKEVVLSKKCADASADEIKLIVGKK